MKQPDLFNLKVSLVWELPKKKSLEDVTDLLSEALGTSWQGGRKTWQKDVT